MSSDVAGNSRACRTLKWNIYHSVFWPREILSHLAQQIGLFHSTSVNIYV